MRGENWAARLWVVFGVTVASFLAATVLTQWQLLEVGRASRDIADNYAPSIERLSTARGEMRRLQTLMRDDPRSPNVEIARDAMDEAIASYLQIPADAEERNLWGDVLRTKDALNAAVERCRAQAAPCDVSAQAEALSVAITHDVELNATRSHTAAVLIEHTYTRARVLRWLMALLCVAIAVLGATALRHAFRAHTLLARQHREMLEVRATELEEFAGRVAHDVLSPLNVVSLAAQAAATSPDASQREEMAARATRAIHRIQRLVSGLLSFAVAGAKPKEGAHARIDAVLEELEPELEAAARERDVELHVEANVASEARCDPGVLASVVSNLAHNAIKYVVKSETRRVDVVASEADGFVRVEVIDTGPGLPPGMEQHVFDPYVRGRNATSSGIGLGLATVKRIATAHGGHVGVETSPGRGCDFWVELPKAQ